MSDRCAAYVAGRRVPLARGGWRHMRCEKAAVTERTRDEVAGVGHPSRPQACRLCGTHAAMWDDPRRYDPILRADSR
jgi:hypothetical protein